MVTRAMAALSVGALLCGAIVMFASGSSATVPAAEERFTDYRADTGAELSVFAALEKGIQHVLDIQGPSSPLAVMLASGDMTVEVVRTNFATAQAVQDGKSPSQAELVGSDAEQTELRQSGVYVLDLTGQFEIEAPRPRGSSAPSGSDLSLIVDAHSGFLRGLQLSKSPVDLTSVGPVQKLPIGTGTGTAKTAEQLDTRRGFLFGTAYSHGKPAAGWRIQAWRATRAHRLVLTTHATARGGFEFHLLPGSYIIVALRPSGKPCSRHTKERIERRHNTFVTLHCG